MDLPTCPTCGQSVIDDDATECPFCGSSMSGGGGSKPAAPSKPASSKGGSGGKSAPSGGRAAKKPAGGASKSGAKAAAKSADAKSVPVDPDDPFAVDSSAHKAAVQAAPKPSKGRTYKVSCPMCETVGFVPRKAAGKDVKCANSECLVPVFTAPAIEQPKDEDAESAKAAAGGSRNLMIGGGVAVALLAGVGIYFAFFASGDDVTPNEIPRAAISDDGSGDDGDGNNTTGTDPQNTTQQPAAMALSEIEKLALDRMVIVSRERDKNRSKAFCRQLTSEAYAFAGDYALVEREMKQLLVVEDRLSYYLIRPFVVMGWKQLADGDAAGAQKSIAEAQKLARNLPKYGRDSLELAMELAAILVATQKADAAWDLIRSRKPDAPEEALLSADLNVIRSFEAMNRPAIQIAQVRSWNQPLQVSVAIDLAIRGKSDAVIDWMSKMASDSARAETLAAVAQVMGQASQLGVTSAMGDLDRIPLPASVSAEADVWKKAAAALGIQEAGGTDEAAKLADEAVAAYQALPNPKAYVITNEQALLDASFDSAAKPEVGLKTGAAVAEVTARLGKIDESWAALQKSMVFARAMAPSPVVAGDVLQKATDRGFVRLTNDFKRKMGLNDVAAGSVARKYLAKCRDMKAAADDRFDLQVEVLKSAATWGLHTQIWEYAKSQNDASSTYKRELFLSSPVPWYLGMAYQKAGDRNGATEIRRTAGDISGHDEDRLRLDVLADVAQGKFRQAGRKLDQQKQVAESWRVRFSQQVLDQILDEDNLDGALELIEGVRNALWREAALNYVASRSTRNGKAEDVWKKSSNREWSATERVAWLRGLVVGISVQGEAAEVSSTEGASTTGE